MHRFLSVAAAAPLLLVSVSAHASGAIAFFNPQIGYSPMSGLCAALVALLAVVFTAPKLLRGILSVLAVLVLCSISLDLAFAAAGAPETVAQSVSESTKVTWAWGEAAQSVASAALTLLSMVAMYFFRRLPENIVAIIGNARVELLLQNAKGWGQNAVKGATDGKTMSVDVGNAVLAEALQYALNNGSAWLLNWAGGPDGIAKKIWARLNLEPEASADKVPEIVATVVEDNKLAA